MGKGKLSVLLQLHILLFVFSLSGILSKLASNSTFLSIRFIACYGGVLLLLGIYAIFWQQIIKKLPLTIAFANKAITVVWAILWGALFFDETITPGRIFGAVMVIIGVILYGTGDREEADG